MDSHPNNLLEVYERKLYWEVFLLFCRWGDRLKQRHISNVYMLVIYMYSLYFMVEFNIKA